MNLTDPLFLFLFLPLLLFIYCICKKEWHNYLLLIVSLFFYACGSPNFFLLLVMSLIVNILIGWMIGCNRERKYFLTVLLVIGIAYNLSLLFYYKYFGLILPLGLSFFTFKAISYLVDIYLGKIDAKTSPVCAALYMSFFAQIQSGPLSRYNAMYGRGGH